ncbi:protein O-mannose kinase [Nephila pilipes]|uniref:Protein O-mannose kinase n=1 Tax=Nephila pilipes TaxID=299642 RepID=A0A8X6T5H9_NEPPI|nr:protein O-mannose kinase [Nephila pilipes]
MNTRTILFCSAVSLLAVYVYLNNQQLHANNPAPQTCHLHFMKNLSVCRPVCPNGTFFLMGMQTCQPWLNCNAKITLMETISTSVVKTVFLAKWEKYEVVLSVLNSKLYEKDFQQNLFMIKALNGNYTVQLVGFCKNNIITEFYALGNALNVNYHLRHSFRTYDSVKLRLDLCINYAAIINFLHSSPVGNRVMCDSNSLEKTLSQFLITDDFRIVVNDLDATPEVTYVSGEEKGVICGNKALEGSFVAPEQLWPYEQKFDPKILPRYNEKTDIFKIPDVCNWFLGNLADASKYKLFNFHKRCKNRDPSKRPSAKHVLEMYNNIRNDL